MSEPDKQAEPFYWSSHPITQALSLALLALAIYGGYRIYTDEL